jgi:hypothetical protein
MDAPGLTAVIYHGRLDTIEFPVNIPCSNASDNCGGSD